MVNDPDLGSDASLLSNSAFGPGRWSECFVAENTKNVLLAASCRRLKAHTREKRL